ncbi:MAG: hypothetical protein KAT90_08035, partial [Gammaproteobacteria bacterium]|nr:hypothetical protein [Gammaproteobacteria bacterium]
IHLIGAEQLTQAVPTTGLVTYNSVGGTSPTIAGFAGNQVGTQTVTATINYDVATVDAMSVNTVFANINTTVTGTYDATMVAPLGGASTTIGLAVACTGACGANLTAATGSGTASINLVGPNAEGIFGSYNLTTATTITGDENTVSGTYFATDQALP